MAERYETSPVRGTCDVTLPAVATTAVNDFHTGRCGPDRSRSIEGVASHTTGAAERRVVRNSTGNDRVNLLIVGDVQTAIQGKQGQHEEANTARHLKRL
ncbi:MAG: hypothetical protein E4H19_05545 [Chromatiales bacterium]|jgi:hypothetical protein|nr:MAG: hypothetical protein E4H19_05545 [Chromatiales bacterium]